MTILTQPTSHLCKYRELLKARTLPDEESRSMPSLDKDALASVLKTVQSKTTIIDGAMLNGSETVNPLPLAPTHPPTPL